MSERIYRYVVPVDDQYHCFDISGDVLHVGCRSVEQMEFWAIDDDSEGAATREFRVVGTGQPLPERTKYVGTAVAPGGVFVWHLLEAAS